MLIEEVKREHFSIAVAVFEYLTGQLANVHPFFFFKGTGHPQILPFSPPRRSSDLIPKNRLYFHRWRPQNETYLFGFRKHEQGKNAKEIVAFDPFIARAEAEIAKLRVPVAHQYEIGRAHV